MMTTPTTASFARTEGVSINHDRREESQNKRLEPGQFTSADVIHLAKISPRQLQLWTEARLVSFSIQGHKKIFRFEDVLNILVIAELRARSVTQFRIRKMRCEIERETEKAFFITGRCFLATDRKRFKLIQVVRDIPHFMKGVCLIPVSELIERIEEHSAGLRMEDLREVLVLVAGAGA